MTTNVSRKVETFFRAYERKKFPKGQIIIFGKETPDRVFYLLSGKVKLYDISYRGDEVILNVFKSPAFFPLSVAINNTSNPYFYESETAVELISAPAKDVVAFLKSNPDVMFDLVSRLYRGLDGMLGKLVHLMAGNARSRLAYELLLEARRFGDLKVDGSCVVGITEKDLGARAGLSRETVNRELHKLKDEKLVTIRRNDILIASLRDLASTIGELV